MDGKEIELVQFDHEQIEGDAVYNLKTIYIKNNLNPQFA